MKMARPIIYGVDVSNEPDRSALASWDGAVRVVHHLPPKASVVFTNGRALVVHPGGAPYWVDMVTGVTEPVDLTLPPTGRKSE